MSAQDKNKGIPYPPMGGEAIRLLVEAFSEADLAVAANIEGLMRDYVDADRAQRPALRAYESFFTNGYVHARKGEHGLISGNADGTVTIAADRYALVPMEHYEELIARTASIESVIQKLASTIHSYHHDGEGDALQSLGELAVLFSAVYDRFGNLLSTESGRPIEQSD